MAAAERSGTPGVAGPNAFEVLGMLRREPAHSAMLAWLLDPEACHGLGDSFLRAFWLRVVGECPTTLTPAMVSRKRMGHSSRAEITVAGPTWRLTIEISASAGLANNETAVSWRIRRERLVEDLAPAPRYERLDLAPALLADLLPAA